MPETMLDRRTLNRHLADWLTEETGKPILLGGLPKDPAKVPVPPYGILYPLSGGGFAGPVIADSTSMPALPYQVTSVGYDERGASWLADRVRQTWHGKNAEGEFLTDLALPAGFGFAVYDRRPDAGFGAADPVGGMVTVPERLLIILTPT